MSHKQVIVIRKDLKMRRGKEIAQGAHASMGALLAAGQYVEEDGQTVFKMVVDDRMKAWLLGSFTKITVTVNTEDEIKALYEKAKELGLLACLITDSGRTEFNGVPTITALAVGPDTFDNIDKITGGLGLY